MNFELFTLQGYGHFVWPAFIFTFLCFFILYLKTKKELNKQEAEIYQDNRELKTKKIEATNRKKATEKFFPAA
mgnify:FL=1